MTAPGAGEVCVCASVGPAGELVAVWTTAEDQVAVQATTEQPGFARFPDPLASRAVAARVTVHAPDIVAAIPVTRLGLAHFTVQPLPQGRILLAGARCRWRAAGADRNAVVCDADGSILAKETLGDGIRHVQADSAGQVWVGYFDEGVFGNFGWGRQFGRDPVGSCGLIRFSADLNPNWRYSSAGSPYGRIHDCYALNVDGGNAWTCYYSDFPIVRIREGTISGWRNNHIPGARALAVSGSRVALYGGYAADHDRLAVGELRDGQLELTAEFRLVLPSGGPLPSQTRVMGEVPCCTS